MNKSIFLSKTFWLQAAALLSLLFPPVKAWFDANPVEFVAALAALNVLLRFATSGKVSLTGGEDATGGSNGSGTIGCVLVFATVGAAAVGTLPSCSPAQLEAARSVPIRACVVTDHGVVCYSSKSGLSAEIRAEK